MRKLFHRLMHLLRWNYGMAYTYWDVEAGKQIIGFKCAKCGKLDDGEELGKRK